MKSAFILFTLSFVMFIACSKSGSQPQSGNTDSSGTGSTPPGPLSEAGYGPSNEPFTTPAWQLPQDVECVDSLHEYSYCWAFPPYIQVEPKDWKGVPLGFTFCTTLHNKNSSKTITITFPPHLVLASSSFLDQGVLVIEPGSVTLVGGSTKTIVLQGFCINKGRNPPQPYVDGTDQFLSYSFGPSEIPSALQEVTDIVESKHITMNDVLGDDGRVDDIKAEKYWAIQTAIWEVTDDNGLTDETRKKLMDL